MRPLEHPRFDPIFARIAQTGLPVFRHPQQTVGGSRLADYYLSNRPGKPVDTAIAASHLILGGVMDRYPTLEITLAHAGGALPILLGRIDAGWNVRHETRAQQPSSYARRVSYDSVSHSGPVLEFLTKNVGVDRLVFGSDYCFDMGYEQPLRFLDRIPLNNARRNMIMGGNAARLLHI